MIKKTNFLTPVITAFAENGELDIDANKRIYDHLIDGGVDGLVIMGSTGEFFTMTTEQKKQLIDLVVNHVNHRTKVYIGTSCMSAEDTIELSNYAINAGADAVMIIGPYYFSLSDESIEFYFDSVCKNINGNVFLYNFPARTGYDLSPAVTLNLLRKNKNIIGFKDTVTEMGHTRKLIQEIYKEFPNFIVYSGFDDNFAHNVLSGGNGCIGGLSNLYPEIFSAWVKACDKGDLEKISYIQQIVDAMAKLYDIGVPFIPIIKKAMVLKGIDMNDYCTKPFLQATAQQEEEIVQVLKEVDDLKKFI
ncbi:dihydrodipicolinate synthase family protein [Terrisporobacter petrolearius]|uniref:dihydrodipicolinate synthase family protein n=1 Tax=Terrisporobacter petrolearius TaxID=1460447 RepID=UPI001D16673A|nr:dihydrodipicolinate synthase family protein [Terrisporobacter petrolearius]MCC3865698.1 dihydrodipicolinate synthase family protein [Terrisporobacter petrolearius]